MPTEVRFVLFTINEVTRAIAEYKKKRGEPIPQGSSERAFVVGTVNPSFVIEMRGPNGVLQPMLVENASLTAALVMFCLNSSIPLPARASKQVKVNGQKLALVVGGSPALAGDRPIAGEPAVA